jgi:hypothetical protein
MPPGAGRRRSHHREIEHLYIINARLSGTYELVHTTRVTPADERRYTQQVRTTRVTPAAERRYTQQVRTTRVTPAVERRYTQQVRTTRVTPAVERRYTQQVVLVCVVFRWLYSSGFPFLPSGRRPRRGGLVGCLSGSLSS